MAETETAEISVVNGGPASGGFSKNKLVELLRQMLLYRRFEERAEEAYAIGKIGGFCHLHIGQEGAAAGCILPLRPDDYVISGYRSHTQALAKGLSPEAVMSELFGKASGCSGGTGGSMHMFGADVGFMGGHGIVGAQAPLALGMAWAIHYRGGDQVCLCFLGDAAVNQGAFHESMNMASIWNLPVIYVVENNAYGMGTKFTRMSDTEMVKKAAAHGVPATSVDGEDVMATYDHFDRLIETVRQGGGPRFVDVECYRFKGHSMSDPVSGTYRSKEEVEDQTENADPICFLRDRMFSAELLTGEELEAIDEEVRAIVDAAVEFAEAAPEPEVDTLYQHVYSEINPHGRLFFDGRGK
ncbi:MAG: pyruvate dehydrogenase (acetyl-transferring) E1 component subunit alpha [Actinobacteria bacterium]|nr:pyruvate dehydrogenase (acetyl-transferring) E1 component subunit alpha [Actinomycetota bacterium]